MTKPTISAFQPITGIFTHQSDLHFDNEDTLGVTYNHPIYSVTADDWRLAGELAVGETVMTLEGVANDVYGEIANFLDG